MSARIYVDANIYLDYLEERTDRIRPLDEFAFQFFNRTLKCEFEIVLSDWVMHELEQYGKMKIKSECLFNELRKAGKLIFVKRTPDDEKIARGGKNWRDALHAIIARRAGCEVLITRDIEHFSDFLSLVQAKSPENL